MPLTPVPIPWDSPVIQLDGQRKPLPSYGLSKEFGNWLVTSIVQPIATAPQLFPSVALTAQNASIGSTPVPLPALASGAYRISYYARITTVDPVSSSLTVSFGWTESSQALTLSGAAMTGNLVTSVQSGILLILSDASSPITYATTYASNTPSTMKYRLFVLIESV